MILLSGPTKKTVRTVAGTGEQNRYARGNGGPGLKTGLNSPWDLLFHDGKLYIAMAGHHQLWTYDPKAYVAGQPPIGTGFVHRGVATWTDGRHRRVFRESAATPARSGRPP